MKVLHLPLETSNQVALICRGLRASGIHAVGYNWRNDYITYEDILIQSDGFEMATALEQALAEFDLFHYHTGYTIFPDKQDILMALAAGKKVVMHHRGNDVRHPEWAKKGEKYENPYVYTGDSQPAEQILKNLEFFSQHIDTAIVQDFELYDYVAPFYRNVHILPRLFNTATVHPRYETTPRKRPLVVHAPTSKAFKGTEIIVKVIEALQEKLPFDFSLIERCSRQEAFQRMQEADIVIDQVLCGMYGNVSVEAMALGKPCLTYVREDIIERLPPGLPIVSAHPDNLYDELYELLKDPERRIQLGMMGRKYVEEHHEARKVVEKLIKIYESLGE